MTQPPVFANLRSLNTHTYKRTTLMSAMMVSIPNCPANGIVEIRAVVPVTNKMLKMLLPMILPIAISEFPFFAAVIEVINSGREVPKATMVRAISLWLIFKAVAILVALSTLPISLLL